MSYAKEASADTHARVIAFIVNTTSMRGYPPSVREIGKYIGYSSSASAQAVLNLMHRRGYIRSTPGTVRSLTVTPAGMALVADEITHPHHAQIRSLLPSAMSYWSEELFSARWLINLDRELPKMVPEIAEAALAVGAIPTWWDGEAEITWRRYPDELD